ncbi:MAG: galactose mutarotase [Lachnospiraceae bacterium]|nr:galactose mutarotase [Lachnospiraceae bacterium]
MNITKQSFGVTSDGQNAYLYCMKNSGGAYVSVTSFGCRIVSICVPDQEGKLRDVCLGYDTLAEYEQDTASFGAVVGRHANRIAKGEFSLNGQTYSLAVNNGPNHLHGGLRGFHYYNWDSCIEGNTVRFTRVSPDGEEGYPGTLTMNVTYSWGEDNELSIFYEARTDQDTVFNTTNHAYFNLDGENADTVLNHLLLINASQFTETDENDLTTGRILDVAGTPMDFTTAKPIGKDIRADYYQLRHSRTYDHNFVLSGSGLTEAAVLSSPQSGIRMTCFTDQPGMQLYVPAGSPSAHGKKGRCYPAYGSVCLETQHFPNATSHPDFPSVILTPGQPFKSKTIYHFSSVS